MKLIYTYTAKLICHIFYTLKALKYYDMKMLINGNKLNLIVRSIYSSVSYKYIFVKSPFTLG